MSAQQSNLSDTRFGYDFVVATTQDSLNATVKQFLYDSEFPRVQQYWNQSSTGDPVAVDRDTLLGQTGGVDPLTVPSWDGTGEMPSDVAKINASDFYFAFEAAIGIPASVSPADIPDVIVLQDNSQTVLFTLLCAEFTIVSCEFGRHGLTSYLSVAQPADQPWCFTSSVALQRLGADLSSLPPAVENGLTTAQNSGDVFSVQQLFLDLDNAALESVPTISGVTPGTPVYTLLSEVFLGAYFEQMKAVGQPVLSYSLVVDTDGTGTLQLSDVELEVTPSDDARSPGAATLDYLCAAGGDALPPPTAFSWAWVEPGDETAFDGVVSVNRNVFAQYVAGQLTPFLSSNCCWAPSVTVSMDGLSVDFSWSMSPDQAPTVTFVPAGPEVVSYTYSAESEDGAGLNDDMGKMDMQSSMNASVSFSGSDITIQRQMVLYIWVRSLQTSVGWNAIDVTVTDTFSLGVTGDTLAASQSTKIADNSQKMPTVNWFLEIFTELNELTGDIGDWATSFKTDIECALPISFAQGFVFPGGNTFAYKDVEFSTFQDMVSRITYLQPGSEVTAVRS